MLEPCYGQWPKLRRGQIRMVVYVQYWTAVDYVVSCLFCSHSHAALSASPHFFAWMLCTDRPMFAACLVSTVFSAQIFSIDAFFWARYVAVYSDGSGCFPLLLPRCRNPCLLRPILRDYTYLVSPEPPCCRVYGT